MPMHLKTSDTTFEASFVELLDNNDDGLIDARSGIFRCGLAMVPNKPPTAAAPKDAPAGPPSRPPIAAPIKLPL